MTYPNLAKFKQRLDEWRDEYFRELASIERANRKRIPEPPRDVEAEARVAQGLRELADQLKRGMGPSSQ